MKKPARWDVVVVGGANFDYLAKGARLPGPGQTLEAGQFERSPGGKGANQAVAAARLGARVAFVGRVGKDSRGDEILEGLKAEGVNVDFLGRDGREPTGVALVMADARGRKQIMALGGANRRLTARDVEDARPAVEAAKVVLAQLEIDDEAVLGAARLAKAAGALFLLDPSPARALPEPLLPLLDLIRPNREEAAVLTGARVEDEGSAAEAARRLMAMGARAACVQAGDKGDLLVWPGGRAWLPRLEVASVDATGAGDAFAGAMAAALAEGRRWEEAGRFASAAAALKTTTVGAQAGLPRRSAVLRLLYQKAGLAASNTAALVGRATS